MAVLKYTALIMLVAVVGSAIFYGVDVAIALGIMLFIVLILMAAASNGMDKAKTRENINDYINEQRKDN